MKASLPALVVALCCLDSVRAVHAQEAPTPLTFSSGTVLVEIAPRDVLNTLRRAREKAGHKDTPEALRKLPIAVKVSRARAGSRWTSPGSRWCAST